MHEEHHMLREIRENHISLEKIIGNTSEIIRIAERIYEENRNLNKIFFVGCGSSYHTALYGAWPLIHSRIKIIVSPASEFIFYYNRLVEKNDLIVGVSRTGRTVETITAIRSAQERGATSVAFVSTSEGELAKISDVCFVADVGKEESVVATKSFTSLSVALAFFSATLSRFLFDKSWDFVKELRKLPILAEQLIRMEEVIRELVKKAILYNAERFILLGSGPAYPIMLEGGLKIRESSYAPAEVFHTLEFRHGPMACINEELMIFLSVLKDEAFYHSKKLLEEIMEKHVNMVLLTNSASVINDKDNKVNKILIPDVESVENAALLSIIPLQFFAYYYAVEKGRNPDKPRFLTKYVDRL